MYYIAIFRERDDVRKVYRPLKDAYTRRNGNPTEIKMNCKELQFPDTALSLLEQFASNINARYKLEQK
jgi:hypothetical protein